MAVGCHLVMQICASALMFLDAKAEEGDMMGSLL